MSDPQVHLDAIFEAQRALLRAEAALFESADPKAVGVVLRRAVDAAIAEDSGPPGPARDDAQARLMRLADLCAQVPGPEMVDALLAILDHDEPAVRSEAGDALLDVAYERFKEVALGVERLLARSHDGASMEELPFILTEIHDPDPVPLVARFLGHAKGDVVASAIEALAEYGDPHALRFLEELVEDERVVHLPDLDDAEATIGDLASDAISMLGGGDEEEEDGRDDEPAPPPPPRRGRR